MKLHRCKELSYLKQPWADLKINFCYEPPDLAGQFDYETWAVIPAEDDKRKRINIDTKRNLEDLQPRVTHLAFFTSNLKAKGLILKN